ncbi:unnamed protein product, partial [Mesorhabditis belari]|uniref:Uncharacterized protein n=1 Tax=Mesorhabditis belari TaxID=2138241 RepID=A0AAF3F535_9BILA
MTTKTRSKSQPPHTAHSEAHRSESRKKLSRGKTAQSRHRNGPPARPPWNNDTTIDYEKFEIKTDPQALQKAKEEQEALNQSWMESLRPDPLGRPPWNNDTTFDYDKHDFQQEPAGRDSKEEQEKLNETWMSSLRGSFHQDQ